MKKTTKLDDKIYRLKNGKTPLSFIISSRNTQHSPLLYFDGKTNKPLRYAKNQKTPFEDEQDGHAVLEPIVFEDGFLRVSKSNPVLQEFLSYHPGNGSIFEELNYEKEAHTEVETMDYELEAQIAAKDLDVELLETIARVVIGVNVEKMTSNELKRDVRVYARNYPKDFLEALNDPLLRLQNKCARFFNERLLSLKNNKKDIYFNLTKNKKKLLTVPFGENHIYILSSYLQSDEGMETLRLLESKLS